MSDKRKNRAPFHPMGRPLPERIEIVSEAVVEEKAQAIVCLRLFDASETMHLMPPSDIQRCSLCGERVIVSKTAPKSPKRICMHCFQARPEGEDPESMLITPSVIREVRESQIEEMRRKSYGVPFVGAARSQRPN